MLEMLTIDLFALSPLGSFKRRYGAASLMRRKGATLWTWNMGNLAVIGSDMNARRGYTLSMSSKVSSDMVWSICEKRLSQSLIEVPRGLPHLVTGNADKLTQE